MSNVTLSVNVFIREEKKAEENLTQSASRNFVGAQTKNFLEAVGNAMNERQMDAKVRSYYWPRNRSTKVSSDQCSSDGYEYLNDPQFDADIAICAVSELERVNSVLGHLLMRERRFLHLCLLSAKPIPEYDEQPDLYRGLLAVPTGARQKNESRIYIAEFETPEGPVPYLTAAHAQTMTIDAIPDMNLRKIHNILDLVMIRKSAA